MNRYASLLAARKSAGLHLGLGLDVEFDRLPPSLVERWDNDPARRHMAIEDFTHEAAFAVSDFAVALKPNLAFAEGEPNGDGEAAMRDTLRRLRLNCPEIPVIVDGKRGDIGNSAKGYARHVFGPTSEQHFDADATTIAPYMGFEDSMDVFIENYHDRTHFVLCRTSNKGGAELQDKRLLIEDPEEIATIQNTSLIDMVVYRGNGGHELVVPQYLYVAHRAVHYWNKHNNVGLVVGATTPDQLRNVCRVVAGSSVQLLIPGSKTQGGRLDVILPILQEEDCLDQAAVFISRGALYPQEGTDGENWIECIEERFRSYHEEALHILKG